MKTATTELKIPRRRNRAKAIRQRCLDCHGGSRKGVKFCPADGVNSSWCPLWPYRFGINPETAAARYGEAFVTPGALPDSNVELEDCESATGARKAETPETPQQAHRWPTNGSLGESGGRRRVIEARHGTYGTK